MTYKPKHNWLTVINECRRSGLSDRVWCTENDIKYSTFYYHVRRLREEACALQAATGTCTAPITQEIVKLNVFDSLNGQTSIADGADLSAAVSLQVHGISIRIQNHASATVITNTLKALQELC